MVLKRLKDLFGVSRWNHLLQFGDGDMTSHCRVREQHVARVEGKTINMHAKTTWLPVGFTPCRPLYLDLLTIL